MKRLPFIILFVAIFLLNCQSIYADETFSKTIHFYISESKRYTIIIPNSFVFNGDTMVIPVESDCENLNIRIPEIILFTSENETRTLHSAFKKKKTDLTKGSIILYSDEYIEEEIVFDLPLLISFDKEGQ